MMCKGSIRGEMRIKLGERGVLCSLEESKYLGFFFKNVLPTIMGSAKEYFRQLTVELNTIHGPRERGVKDVTVALYIADSARFIL